MIWISQIVLYSLGPFFSYPWKPLFNYFKGSPYSEAYKHFWDQHKCPSNQAWHYVCLFFQIFSNFAFLSKVDSAFAAAYPVVYLLISRPISKLTLLMWLVPLLMAPASCPFIVKALSTLHLLFAYSCAPLVENSPIELWAMVGFGVVLLLHLIFSRKKIIVSSDVALYISLICLKLGGLYFASNTYRGTLKAYSYQLETGSAVIMSILCALNDPVKGSVLFGTFGGAALSVLIDKPCLLLLSYAYSASLLQGLAHALSREQPTLLKLQSAVDREKKMSDEWGHVVFFPNLLLQSIYTTLMGKKIA